MKTPILFFVTLGSLLAQIPSPTQQPRVDANTGQAVPIFRITVVSRTMKAINYNHRDGSTPIDFRGTELMPAARGTAKVDSRMGSTKIDVRMDKMTPASQFGAEYMTYVLWAITPEGRANNLGEVVLMGDHANLLSTTDLQSFGLLVTAEPYFAVTQPSDVVVAENFVAKGTEGTIQEVDAKFELLQRGQYVFNRSLYKQPKVNPKGPLQLAQAENAVQIARLAGADRYAADTYQKAVVDLKNAEDFLNGKSKDRKRSETNAREAAQMAEDARIITFRKIREEELANERAAAAAREGDANEKARLASEQANAEKQRRAAAESDQRASEIARQQAEKAKAEAQQATMQADSARSAAEKAAADAVRERSAADAARLAAEQQQQAAMAEADRAKLGMAKAESEKAALRERLRTQLNLILETRESARGLIVNISDVLFDTGKYTLKPGAREKLAKVAGILLAYPGLNIKVEGHTDSVGGDEYNMKLSDSRANSVREYITAQNVPAANVTAVGLGKTDPVATNDTAAGRQQNRRVELVVSGDPIGIGDIGNKQ